MYNEKPAYRWLFFAKLELMISLRRTLTSCLILWSGASCASSSLLKSEFTESAFKLTKFDSDKAWELSTEFGGSFTSGNTDTQSYKGKIKGSVAYSLGRLNYHAQMFKKISKDKVSADKWKIGLKNNLDFSAHKSSFASLEYERNKFSSYDSVATFAAGYTQLMFNDDTLRWDADVGPGYKWKESNEQVLREYVMHLGTNMSLALSEHSKFIQTIIADFGLASDSADVIRSESALLTSILENLKMKLTYAFKHNNRPGENKVKLDTQTTVSLVFIF